MAKLRHIIFSVSDLQKAAGFYCKTFDMEYCRKTNSSLANRWYVTDGVITVSLLTYKKDERAGYVHGEDERGKDWESIHHIDFWVDTSNRR